MFEFADSAGRSILFTQMIDAERALINDLATQVPGMPDLLRRYLVRTIHERVLTNEMVLDGNNATGAKFCQRCHAVFVPGGNCQVSIERHHRKRHAKSKNVFWLKPLNESRKKYRNYLAIRCAGCGLETRLLGAKRNQVLVPPSSTSTANTTTGGGKPKPKQQSLGAASSAKKSTSGKRGNSLLAQLQRAKSSPSSSSSTGGTTPSMSLDDFLKK